MKQPVSASKVHSKLKKKTVSLPRPHAWKATASSSLRSRLLKSKKATGLPNIGNPPSEDDQQQAQTKDDSDGDMNSEDSDGPLPSPFGLVSAIAGWGANSAKDELSEQKKKTSLKDDLYRFIPGKGKVQNRTTKDLKAATTSAIQGLKKQVSSVKVAQISGQSSRSRSTPSRRDKENTKGKEMRLIFVSINSNTYP